MPCHGNKNNSRANRPFSPPDPILSSGCCHCHCRCRLCFLPLHPAALADIPSEASCVVNRFRPPVSLSLIPYHTIPASHSLSLSLSPSLSLEHTLPTLSLFTRIASLLLHRLGVSQPVLNRQFSFLQPSPQRRFIAWFSSRYRASLLCHLSSTQTSPSESDLTPISVSAVIYTKPSGCRPIIPLIVNKLATLARSQFCKSKPSFFPCPLPARHPPSLDLFLSPNSPRPIIRENDGCQKGPYAPVVQSKSLGVPVWSTMLGEAREG